MSLKHQFVQSCKSVGMAGSTISLYDRVLSSLEQTVGDLGSLDADGVDLFMKRELSTNSRSTAHTKLMAIRSFVRWAVDREKLPPILLNQIPTGIKHSTSTPRVATREQVEALLGTLRPKHQVALLLMADSGLRAGEVVTLKVRHVNLRRRVIEVVGKGQRYRLAPIPTEELYERLVARVDQADPDEWVIPGRNGSQLCTSALRKVITRACKRVGIDQLNPHAFRHYFASTAARSGINVKAIQGALGHSSLNTTDIYLRSLVGAEELTSAFSTFGNGDHN